MKKVQIISRIVLIVAVIIYGINFFIISFPDWTIRLNGIVMLLDMFILSYSTVKSYKENKQ